MTPHLGGAPPLGAPPTPTNHDQLAAVAVEQRGLLTRRQCLAAGMSDKALQWRIDRRRWVAVHPGVYQTAPGREDWWTTALAAHLACGSQAAWSHETAGYFHGLIGAPPELIDVLVDHGHVTTDPSGAHVRRSRHVDRRVDPMRWPWRTTVEETLLDLADEGSVDRMFAVLGRAFQQGLTSEEDVLRCLAARSRHSRRALLKVVLEDVAEGAESAMEVRYARDVERAHGLPRGVRQQPGDGGRVRWHDVGYLEHRVLIELDGRLGHEGRGARVRDGVRDRKSATTGWLTARAFWRDVTVLRCELAADVGAILRSRGWSGAAHACRLPGCPLRMTPAR